LLLLIAESNDIVTVTKYLKSNHTAAQEQQLDIHNDYTSSHAEGKIDEVNSHN